MIDRAIGIVAAFIALGTLAVVVSKKSDTAKVLGVSVTGLNALFKTALSPVTN